MLIGVFLYTHIKQRCPIVLDFLSMLMKQDYSSKEKSIFYSHR